MSDVSHLVHPIRDDALGNTAYLVEIGDGMAISIDPRRDADEHVALSRERGLTIAAVFETHVHADFISGSREIAAATGAEIIAAAAAGLRFAHRSVSPGEELRLGDASVTVIATPGHTVEHVAYLIVVAGEQLLFSGGSLIVGGAARTDLSGDGRTAQLARRQYASIHELARLLDDTRLYPTHGGGSFCSTGGTRSKSSTIGAERASNPLLGISSEDAFVEELLSGLGSYPRYFSHLPEMNRSGAPLLSSLGALAELEPAIARQRVANGAWLVDARPIDRWAAAHPEGSISIEMRPAFASWLGWVVPFGEPVLLVLEPSQVVDATRLARRIGYDRVEGWVRFSSWRDAGSPVSSMPTVTSIEAAERARGGAMLLDVRQAREFARDHIPGATHLELGDIIAGKSPDATETITYCGHGERSATAASLLARRGLRVANLEGGSSAWEPAAPPVAG